MRTHCALGASILATGASPYTRLGAEIALNHHERWDGKGYPYGLGGDRIPLMGRIICVADSFDAMSSTRTHRPALPLQTVLAEIKRCAGSQFDPALANVFVTLDFTAYRQSIEKQLHAGHIGYNVAPPYSQPDDQSTTPTTSNPAAVAAVETASGARPV